MADKSFGIKELNLISSGTPKIESPNNLNLSAVTVAISTNATVGGTLDVDGHTELDDVNISGVSTFAGITTVTGQTLFTKQLGVSGITTFNSIVNFPGASYNALWNKAFNRFEFKDGASAVFGTGNDLEIKHSGGNTTLKNISGEFRIAGNDIRIQNQTSSTDFIKVNSTGSVVTGILTATSFSGSLDASDLASGTIPDARFPATLPAISGINLTNLPAGTPTNSDIQVVYTVTANGSSAYRFAGNGTVSTEDNPDVYLIRGLKYRFINNSGGSHPFEIRGSSGGTAYSVGVTNNGASSGNIDFQVPYSSPSHLYYQCTSHGGMVGNLYIRGAGGNNTNVGVTTFTGGLTVKALNINTSGAGDGDLLSNGGSDGIFGIFNTTNSGEISLNIKDSGGTYNNILSLVNDRATIDGNVGVGTTNPTAVVGVGNTAVLAVGIVSAYQLYGDGSNLTGLSSGISNVVEDTSPQLGGDLDLNSKKITGTGNISMTGIATATGFRSSTTTGNGSDVAFATKYYITANGSSAYRFAGAGVLNTTDDPTLYFHRGFTYILENSTGGSHPFELRLVSGGSAYAPGGQFLTGSTTGTQILTVPMDAPASIVYQCTIHGSMLGTINFVQ